MKVNKNEPNLVGIQWGTLPVISFYPIVKLVPQYHVAFESHGQLRWQRTEYCNFYRIGRHD
jgi:hypothetical protein